MTLVRSEEVRVDEMIAGAGIPEMVETAEIAEARAEEIFEVGDAREEVVMIVAAEGRVAEDAMTHEIANAAPKKLLPPG